MGGGGSCHKFAAKASADFQVQLQRQLWSTKDGARAIGKATAGISLHSADAQDISGSH